jgi:predicted dehydrogenase
MEAMCTRFLPHIVEVSRLVNVGALGEIVTVIADLGYRFPKDPKSRFFAPELGGGVLLDCGVYPVSLASMVLGRPEQVRGLVTRAFTGVDGQTSILLGFSSGAHAVLTCNSSAHTPTRASIVGTEARIEIDRPFYAPSSLTIIGQDGSANRFEPHYDGTGLHFEADEVERCVRAGLSESPVMPLDETLWIMEIMDAVLAQALTGPGTRPA